MQRTPRWSFRKSAPRLIPAGALVFLLGLLTAPAPAAALTAQTAPTDSIPTIQQAIGLIQQGDFAGAADVAEKVADREPDNARAWSVLGFARRRAGDTDGAVEAYRRAMEFDAVRPQAIYNLGMIHAERGDVDRAFELLLEAKATGRLDMTQVGMDPASSQLREDPRYASLFPDEEAFADPFVEPARIIHEWRGESAGDQFGWIARNIGDVDGDGVADAVTSAPTRTIGEAQNAGRVYVYSGRSGALLWTADGEAGDQLGLGVEAAGDLNADGVPDVGAGAPGNDRAYVFSGVDGSVLLALEPPNAPEFFGREIMDLGDVDGDGHDDIIVGAPRSATPAGQNVGRAYIVSGADGSVLLELTGEGPGDAFGSAAAGYRDGERTIVAIGAPNAGRSNGGRVYVYAGRGLSEQPAFVIEADDTGSQLGGMFISVVGDVDADGAPDVYASDWANGAKGQNTGRIFVHSGRTGERLLSLTGEASGDGFGIGPADAGDVNGDGHDDLVIGAWQQATAAPAGGKVYLFSGADGSLLREYTGKVMGETFGFDATGMGDVDGDGTIDFLLTSAWSAVNGPRSGRVYIVSGEQP